MIGPDRQPTLTSDTVLIRPVRTGDWDALFAVASDPAIWAVHPAHDRWREPVFRAFFDEGLASGGGLTIIDRATGAVIGFSRYGEHDPERDRIEIGWTFLARSHWGGATNREIKRLMLAHMLAAVPTVFFRIGEDNVRSRRAVEKIGGTLIDETEVVERGGRPVGHVFYTVDRVPA